MRDVLNACRHHGKEDARGAGLRRPALRVLNACRHHGKEDALLQLGRDLSHECSTPVGITARRTRTCGLASSLPGHPVLNACRHHGKEDLNTSATRPSRSDRCSTPVGITARRTLPSYLLEITTEFPHQFTHLLRIPRTLRFTPDPRPRILPRTPLCAPILAIFTHLRHPEFLVSAHVPSEILSDAASSRRTGGDP